MTEIVTRHVTAEQLRQGFVIKWSNDWVDVCDWTVLESLPDGTYIVQVPKVTESLAYPAKRRFRFFSLENFYRNKPDVIDPKNSWEECIFPNDKGTP